MIARLVFFFAAELLGDAPPGPSVESADTLLDKLLT